jgi:hypothetical protein
MRIRSLVVLLAALCPLAVGTPAAQPAVGATAHDLGAVNGSLDALTMNDRGVIAAWGGSDGTFVLDTRTGTSVTLPYFEPRAVNNRGEVVGIFDAPISAGGFQGTSWSEQDGLQRMPDFVPSAINDRGEMAGNCLLGPNQWGPPCVGVTGENGQRTLQVIDVGAEAIEARAHDINDHGEVVGIVSYATGLTRGFRWSRRDGLLLLEPASPTGSSAALAINNRGVVAGQTSDQTTSMATKWTWSGDIAEQLMSDSTAIDINDHGIAVVTTLAPATGVFESKVWVPVLGVFELPPVPGSTGAPLASEINNHNEVVGQMASAGGANYHLVVWTVGVHEGNGTMAAKK